MGYCHAGASSVERPHSVRAKCTSGASSAFPSGSISPSRRVRVLRATPSPRSTGTGAESRSSDRRQDGMQSKRCCVLGIKLVAALSTPPSTHLLPLPRYLCFPAPGPFASAGSPPPAKQNARQPAVAGEAGHLVLALPRRLLEPRVGAPLAASSMHRVPLAAMGECRTLLQMPQHPPSQIRVALGAEASEVGRGWAGS